jgi:hypothetical protein
MADMETWTWFQEQIALLKKAAKDNEVHRKGYTIKFKWRGGDGYGGAGRRTHDFGFFRPDGAPPLRSTSSVAAALGVDAAQLRGTKETESAPADKKGENKRGAAAAAGTEGAAAAAAKRPKTSGDVKKDTSRSGAAGAKAKSAVTDKPPKASASHEAVVARLRAQATEAKAEAKQLNEKLVKYRSSSTMARTCPRPFATRAPLWRVQPSLGDICRHAPSSCPHVVEKKAAAQRRGRGVRKNAPVRPTAEAAAAGQRGVEVMCRNAAPRSWTVPFPA